VIEQYVGNLVEERFEWVLSENGELAVSAYQTGLFDLIVMDVQMPVMDGLTATCKIRAMEKENARECSPILVLTANALPEDITRAMTAGCDAHLSKPISKSSFLKALEQWQRPPKSAKSKVRSEIPASLR
jgi:CheY-like chemotaxis protein